MTYPLVGRFNVENVMTAFGVALQLGYAPSAIAEALRDVPAVPGRLQRVSVENDGGISVYVDYAHTPDALEGHRFQSLHSKAKARQLLCSVAEAIATQASVPLWERGCFGCRLCGSYFR